MTFNRYWPTYRLLQKIFLKLNLQSAIDESPWIAGSSSGSFVLISPLLKKMARPHHKISSRRRAHLR